MRYYLMLQKGLIMNIVDFCYCDKEELAIGSYRPDWMGMLSNSLYLSELSIPGSHDSVARFDPVFLPGSGVARCQSLTLDSQLKAGLRAFDIRLYQYSDHFEIWHGIAPTDTTFENVMKYSIDFLDTHPSETIIMRAKHAGSKGNVPPFSEMFDSYLKSTYKGGQYKDWVWAGDQNGQFKEPPALGNVRKKIVILQDFKNDSNVPAFGMLWPQDKPSSDIFDIQDNYKFSSTHKNFGNKWSYIRGHIIKAMTDKNPEKWYINFTSGTGGIIGIPNPASVAHGFKRVWFEKFCDGMNVRTWEYITKCYDSSHKLPDPKYFNNNDMCAPFILDHNNEKQRHGRLGIIFMDFPGYGLIDAIIAHNGLDRLFHTQS